MLADANKLQFRITELLKVQPWPHDVGELQLLETHISWVILTGKFAYKIKKPVNFGFVNYETLQRRMRFCQLEVELNRRFAPDLYLGVVPIFDDGGTLKVGDVNDSVSCGNGGPQPIDYAVKMRQFSQEAIVAAHVSHSDVPTDLVESFGSNLAKFHNSIESAIPTLKCVQPEQIIEDALDNFVVLEEFFAEDCRLEMIQRLKTWTSEQSTDLVPNFQARLDQGMVRRCHGDLHLKNIIQLPDRLQAFDGIEFNQRLQWIDMLSEVAFPVMDFLARGRPNLAWRLLNSYLEATGDYDAPEVLRFYLVYRALVRAKVTCLNLANSSDEERDRHATGNEVFDRKAGTWDKYLEVAEHFAFDLKPKLSITHGFSGSGKSTAAMKLIDMDGGIRIRSDVERRRLAEKFHTQEKYSSAMSDWVYTHLLELAQTNLRGGFPVLVDATFLKLSHRLPFQKLAESMEVEFEILDCDASYEELCRRIRSRFSDPSEATTEVLDAQMQSHDPLTTEELQFVRNVGID